MDMHDHQTECRQNVLNSVAVANNSLSAFYGPVTGKRLMQTAPLPNENKQEVPQPLKLRPYGAIKIRLLLVLLLML